MKYLVKLALFSAFVGILYFAISIAVGKASDFISSHLNLGANAIYIMHRFKICEAINIFISGVIGSWIVNKIINYWMG